VVEKILKTALGEKKDNKRIEEGKPANTSQKKAIVAILISDKVDFTAKNITKDKKKSFHTDKGVNSSERDNNLKLSCT